MSFNQYAGHQLLNKIPDKLFGALRRNSVLVKNSLGTVALKGGSIVVSLASTPAYIRYFSDNGSLGVWFTMLSILNWMVLLDFGVGNGLRNSLVPALARADRLNIRALISSGYFFAAAVSLAVGFSVWVLVPHLDLPSILGVESGILTQADLVRSIRILVVGVALQVVLRNVVLILYSMQRLVVANSLSLWSSVAMLVYLLQGKALAGYSSLDSLAIMYTITTLVPTVLATIWVFASLLPRCAPRLRAVTVVAMRQVVGMGLGFFLIQVALLIINATDQLLIASLFGSDAVVLDQVYLRLFSLFGVVFQLLSQPVWSAVAAKKVAGSSAWVSRAFRLLLAMATLGSIVALLLVPFTQFLFDIWLGNEAFVAAPIVGLVFAMLAATEMFLYALTSIANGLSLLKTQIVFSIFGAAAKIPIVFLLREVVNVWWVVVLAHALCLVPLVVAQGIALSRHLRDTARGAHECNP